MPLYVPLLEHQVSENERTDSDSSIDNNLDHLCTAKSTEFKLKDNTPGFEYISKTDHASWLDSCKSIQRISAYETLSLMLLFLRSVMKFFFVNVGGSLRGKVHTRQATFLTPVIT